MKMLKNILLYTWISIMLLSCGDLLLPDAPIGRDNTEDPETEAIITGRPEINVIFDNKITLSGDEFIFPDTETGRDIAINGLIQNKSSDTPLNVGTIDLTTNEFTVSQFDFVDADIPAGEERPFTITFAPSETRIFTDEIQINNDDSNEAPYIIKIQGEGLPATSTIGEINVRENATNIPDGGILRIDDTQITTSRGQSFIIENIHQSYSLEFTQPPSITITGTDKDDFSIEASTMPSGTLAAGASVSVGINFAPTSIGNKTATLNIYTNDEDESPYLINLEATATEIPPGEIQVEIGGAVQTSGATHIFPDTAENTSSSVDIVIKNVGTDPLVLNQTPVEITGTAFSSSNQPSANYSIAASDSYTLTVEFSPSAAQEYSGSVTINSNDSDEGAVTINLQGTGTDFSPLGVEVTDFSSDKTILVDSYIAPNSDITLGGDIIVNPGATLTIYEGASLNMGSFGFTIYGHLHIAGKADEEVLLTGNQWAGITISGNTDNSQYGTAVIDHAYLKELNDGSSYAIKIGDNVSTQEAGNVTISNSRIVFEGYASAIWLYRSKAGATYRFNNNIFTYLNPSTNARYAIRSDGYGNEIDVEIDYNTYVSKYSSSGGYAYYIGDSNLSTYNFHHNLTMGNSANISNVIYSTSTTPNITAQFNVYDSAITNFETNADNVADNLSLSIYSARTDIFTNYDFNDFTMKMTNTYPTSSQTSITELVGSLSLTDNQVGAYGNGGTPPAP